MNKEGIKILDNFKSNIATGINDNAKAMIKKSDFDKTLIGFVSEKIERDDGSYRWRIQTNGVAYDIKPEMSNITDVGQRVRLFIPNHRYQDKYAEVITDNSVVCTKLEIKDDKVIFGYSDDTTEEVTVTRDDNKRITSFTVGEKTIEVNWNVSE